MSLGFSIQPESGFLRVIASGSFSLGEAKAGFLDVLDAVKQHRLTKVLIDARELSGDPTTMERFGYGQFVAQTVNEVIGRSMAHSPRFAYVLKAPFLHPEKLSETIAGNRGVALKIFDNIDSAMEWLDMAKANTSPLGGY
ncbi:MAG: hypothetical protein GC149_07580 [Gammaproteobacteria bacterium]|nr:hypothetical protein [Gammaproteobacteria bacterium]